MKLDRYQKLPVYINCLTLVICVVILFLPIEQILTVYKVVNGVKTVEFVSKAEGIFRLIIVSVASGVIWILFRKWIEKKITNNPEYMRYYFIKFYINFFFFAWTSLPSVMGILSIILWLRGI